MSSFDSFSSAGKGFQTEAVVKWFNLTKGFGFVAPLDGSSDAFIHSSVVNRAGLRDVAEGTKMVVEIGDGEKGRQVLGIVQVLGVTEIPQPARAPATGSCVEMAGTVKWFKPDKGFGFAASEDGGQDVFIHRSVVLRCGAQTLEPGQKLRMTVTTAAKGREAAAIEIVN